MATILLPPDFRDFLQLLNSEKVEYLVVGGYAVGYYGYLRATGDLDVWIAVSAENAARMVKALQQFGFAASSIPVEPFLKEKQVIRMGFPPLRIEVLTTISGVDFAACYSQRTIEEIEGINVNFISLQHLKLNKKAAGRTKDLNDLENLP